MPAREVQSTATSGAYHVDLRTDRHAWTLDERSDSGGHDGGPTPVEALLGALVSCLTISFQFTANRKKVPIDRIEGWVASNDQRYIEQIAIELQVWSSAPEADVRALLPNAERGCFVKAVLKPEIALTIDLTVHHTGG